jgi:hypothetical protein
LVDAAHLDITKLFLEELKIAATIAHLGVKTRPNSFIVRLGPHRIGGIDEGLLPLNLLVDVVDRVIVIHCGRGCAMRSRGTTRGWRGRQAQRRADIKWW